MTTKDLNDISIDQSVEPTINASVFEAISTDPEIREYLYLADEHLGVIGFTEHGLRHGGRVSKTAAKILSQLQHTTDEVEMARIAGFLHDIGNFICRTDHGQTGACLLHPILQRFGLSHRQLGLILSAIGNHEEQYGKVFNSICAAVVIGDKADVHRSRVRDYDPSRRDIHDDVNYAVTNSQVEINANLREIQLVLEIDDSIASVMDYFEIFISRMAMCRNAASFLGCSFTIIANGTKLS